MANASLILETALLLLAAFLLGCVVGSLARWLSRRRPKPAAVQPEAPALEESTAAPLVAVPQVAPLFQRTPGPNAAQRFAAAAGQRPPEIEAPSPPEQVAPAPVTPPAPAEQVPTAAIREERRPARVAGQLSAPTPAAREAPVAPAPAPVSPENDAETAARQAVEGGWTPARRRSPAPFPETTADDKAADDAVAGVRSAVAAARAAADAALAELPDEPVPEAKPSSRIRRGFGAPELLDAPREGGKDDLTAIRGISLAVEASLNTLGIFHFDQLAGWDRKAVVWVDSHLGLKGRVAREKWPEQARSLVSPMRSVRPRR